MILILAGLPGTGKSTLARALAHRLGGVVLDKDAIRAALFPPAHVEYSVEQDDFCQGVMLETAGFLLGRDRTLNIFLDGRTFSRKYQRDRAVAFAVERGAPWAIVECVCRDETALSRLARDLSAGAHPARNRDQALYHSIRASFEPIAGPKLVVDTDDDLEPCLERVTAFLAGTVSPREAG